MSKKIKSAAMLGRGLAVLQHSFDNLFKWGFTKMKKKAIKKEKNPSQFTQVLKKIGGFLGIMGEEYYKKYEELKKTNPKS